MTKAVFTVSAMKAHNFRVSEKAPQVKISRGSWNTEEKRKA